MIALFYALPFLTATIDLSRAVVVTREPDAIAAKVLVEEVQKRTGLRLRTASSAPENSPAITIAIEPSGKLKREGYRLQADRASVHITGADARGTLYGVGHFLRTMTWSPNQLTFQTPSDITTAPAYPIRGHQLGYRTQANSYDAWTVAQFEQYIRELAFFGVNSIESIPFHDDRPTPVMKVPRREMNRAMSEICYRYGLDYWAWTPADFDLKDTAQRAKMLERFDEFFKDSKELTGVFFPGGDPGNNPPELVLPFLEDVSRRMLPVHPKARVWLSLQWFNAAQVDSIYAYIEREKPAWLGGLVAGPSSPRVQPTRVRLPQQYKLRLYPDLTHDKICEYQVPSWDQAYALTLGREAINPRPSEFALIHNWFAPYSDGFISYSDGVHDDVNKTVFSALSWDPARSVRSILTDYAHVYFDPAVAEPAADGILALERNWRGPLAANGAVESTLLAWQRLEQQAPQLESNWRWQMCLLRANYDAYVRRRLINETQLENAANAILAQARVRGAERAMTDAASVLNRAVDAPVSPRLRARIEDLCAKLFQSIGLQTSVDKYFASGEERGAVLDFVDYPLNNRWWLEDEFQKIRNLPSESAKVARLETIATWEHPGPGSFYDNVGNESKSHHVVRGYSEFVAPEEDQRPEPMFWWWEQGKSRARLSWQATMWPHSLIYEGVDPSARYTIRSTGYGQALLRINGERVEPTVDGKQMGEFKEFPVAPRFLKERRLVLTWDKPTGEEKLNWRNRSRLSEVWLLRQN